MDHFGSRCVDLSWAMLRYLHSFAIPALILRVARANSAVSIVSLCELNASKPLDQDGVLLHVMANSTSAWNAHHFNVMSIYDNTVVCTKMLANEAFDYSESNLGEHDC